MLDDLDRAFEAELVTLRRMSDDDLLSRWRENDAAAARSLDDSDELRLRHYAFRYLAVERLGAGFGTPAMFSSR